MNNSKDMVKESEAGVPEALLRVLPCMYDSFEEVNAEDRLSITIGGTVYDVRTHFNIEGKQSVFEQLKKLLLSL